MSTTNLLPLLILSFVTAACAPGPNVATGDAGNRTADASPDASAPLDYPTYVAQMTVIGCAFLHDCCDAGERAALGSSHTDVEACVRAQSDALMAATEAVVRSIADGELTYDAALAARCLDALGGASCGVLSLEVGRVDGECIDVIRGTTPLGGDCSSAACADAICFDGVCEPYPSLGEACTGFRCAGGAFCIEGTCTANLRAEGGSCERDLDCERGLICRDTCVPLDRCLGE